MPFSVNLREVLGAPEELVVVVAFSAFYIVFWVYAAPTSLRSNKKPNPLILYSNPQRSNKKPTCQVSGVSSIQANTWHWIAGQGLTLTHAVQFANVLSYLARAPRYLWMVYVGGLGSSGWLVLNRLAKESSIIQHEVPTHLALVITSTAFTALCHNKWLMAANLFHQATFDVHALRQLATCSHQV